MAKTAAPEAPAQLDALPLGRDSVTYRIMLEPFNVFVGGPRALMLQVTQPNVAAGVAQFSDYENNPWNRLIRTLQTMTQLAIGSPEKSRAMARNMRRSHAAIKGTRDDGQPYRALDPENMLWVWATLLDTLIVVHDRFVRPLGRGEREQLYREWVLIAQGCGVPVEACPADYQAFTEYVAEVIDHELVATDTARGVARMLAAPPLPGPLGLLSGLAATVLDRVVPSQLPPALRESLGYRWTDRDEQVMDAVALASRIAARITPGPLRRLPGAISTFGMATLPMPAPDRRRRPAAADAA